MTNNNENAKLFILSRLVQILKRSQNLRHTKGTTQTTTNILSAEFKDGNETVKRTTRYIHQEQVAEQATSIVKKVNSAINAKKEAESESADSGKGIGIGLDNGQNRYYESLASIAGLTHDIGHCTYGHDGEATIDSFVQSFSSVLSENQKKRIQATRNEYFSTGNRNNGYEEQQDWQNELIGQEYKKDSFIFDHGEESAWAIVNICETNKDSILQECTKKYSDVNLNAIFSEIQKDLVQCALMHSRPAFSKSNPAAEAVAIADSVAFIQDDLDQAFLANRFNSKNISKQGEKGKMFAISECERYRNENFSKINNILAKELKELGSVINSKGENEYFSIENLEFASFISSDSEFRKNLVTQEIATNYSKRKEQSGDENVPILNGKHLDDLMWYAGKIKSENNEKFLEQQIDLLKRAGFDENLASESTDIGKWNKLCKKVIENYGNTTAQKSKDENNNFAEKIKAILELRYKIEFPINYACYCINQAVISNNLIYGKNLGNNTTKDGASTRFMLLKLYKGYISEFGNEDLQKTAKNYDEKSTFGEGNITREQKATENCTFKDFFNQIRKTEEFKKLKQAISSGKTYLGIETNSFKVNSEVEQDVEVFRRLGFHINDINKDSGVLDTLSPVQIIAKMVEGMTNEFSRTYTRELVSGMTYETLIEQGMLDVANIENINEANRSDRTNGRLLTPQDLLGLGYTKEQINEMEISLRKKNQSFSQVKVWNKATKSDQYINAISYGIEEFDKDIRKQFNALSTELTGDERFTKIHEAFSKLDNLIEQNKNTKSEFEIEKLVTLRHRLSVELSKKLDILNLGAEISLEESIEKTANVNDSTEKNTDSLQNSVKIAKTKDEFLNMSSREFAVNAKQNLDSLLEILNDPSLSQEEISKLHTKLNEFVNEIEREFNSSKVQEIKNKGQQKIQNDEMQKAV